MKINVFLAQNTLVLLADMALGCAIDGAIQRKMRGVIVASRAGVARPRKGITLVVLKKDIENSCVLIDGVIETVKHEIKSKKVDFLICC